MFVFLVPPPFPTWSRSWQVSPGEVAGEVWQRETVWLPVPQIGASGGAAAGLLLRQLQHQRGACSVALRLLRKLSPNFGLFLLDLLFLCEKTTRCWRLILKCRLNQSKKIARDPFLNVFFFFIWKGKIKLQTFFTESFSSFYRCWCRFTDRSL